MNQVISFERVIFFGYIQEVKKDPSLAGQLQKRHNPKLAFGTRIAPSDSPNRLLPKIKSASAKYS